jgi:hypothetical protein
MARTLGLIPTTDDLPFQQQPYHVIHFAEAGGPGEVLNDSSKPFVVGNFAMPWDGELHASLTVEYSWLAGYFQHVQASMVTSLPGPNWSPVLLQMAHSMSTRMRGQVPVYARWDNLMKGQVVNLSLYFQVGNGGIAVGCESVSGSVRATRMGA